MINQNLNYLTGWNVGMMELMQDHQQQRNYQWKEEQNDLGQKADISLPL